MSPCKVYLTEVGLGSLITGWPFSSLNSFGYFLLRLYESTENYPLCRLSLLKELWYIATDLDQWAVQAIVVNLINHNEIPEGIIMEFSIYIMETGQYFSKLDTVNLSGIAGQLKNAINHLK